VALLPITMNVSPTAYPEPGVVMMTRPSSVKREPANLRGF
jgi:hypothetical protein